LSISPLDRLVRKLESITPLTDSEKQAVLELSIKVRVVRADQDIVREGDRPTSCCLVIQGFLYLYKVSSDGGRQILSFHVPGDIPDLQSLHLGVLDHGLATATESTVAYIDHDAVLDLCHSYPLLADKFWRQTLVDGAIFREWITNIGTREAPGRIAHILCEMFLKLQAVGLTKGSSFEFPFTQGEIGDATGLSTVHVNRSIQKLRGDRLITLEKGRCTIWSWEGLREAGTFDGTYLHIQDSQAA
jgi:CRP-like cAMP-binding protein